MFIFGELNLIGLSFKVKLNEPRSTTESRQKLVNSMLEYHKPAFSLLGIEDPAKVFYCKPLFKRRKESHVSLYERELLKPGGFYLELCDDQYTQPLYAERTLYRIRANKDHLKEYEFLESGVGPRYLVPIDELEKIDLLELIKNQEIKTNTAPVKETPVSDPHTLYTDIIDDDMDENLSKLTIRDLCAIVWKKPVSPGKEWLNLFIMKTFKNT